MVLTIWAPSYFFPDQAIAELTVATTKHSAISMLGARDNEQHSYLEIAYALAQNGAAPEEDMVELWRRIVFNIMIANTDDHLRNHGFVYERYKGWRLSPA